MKIHLDLTVDCAITGKPEVVPGRKGLDEAFGQILAISAGRRIAGRKAIWP